MVEFSGKLHIFRQKAAAKVGSPENLLTQGKGDIEIFEGEGGILA